MEKQLCSPTTTPPSIAMHKNSLTISKTKPKIRIIHIFAPEIIKTDAENFRELVQRLTGKPTGDDEKTHRKEKPSRVSRKKLEPRPSRINFSSSSNKKMEMGMSMRSGFHRAAGLRERIKGEEEIWNSANSGGDFLGGLPEFDGFMQELNQQFPFLEGTTQMDAYGDGLESQLAN